MLSKERNRLLCAVADRDAVGGKLFRSIWLPAVLSSQLPAPACPPVRLKLLGEELLAIRDGEGRPGIVQSRCAHRQAPLYFGRMEDAGIRCAYHGWLYDRTGQCIEMPSEANESLCRRVRLKSYPVEEKAGIVWVYLGEAPAPQLPRFPWIDLPDEQRLASVWLQETNWFQGVEGEIDSSHVSTLHKSAKSVASTRVHRHYTSLDPKPAFFVEDTDIGFVSIARRRADDAFYWRGTQWMAPMFTLIPSAAWPIGGRAWVPIDDENTYCWDFNYSLEGPLPKAFREFVEQGLSFPPQCEYRPCELNTGSIIDTWYPRRNRHNDYLIDRHLQKTFSTTGIHGVNDQDRAMQDGMGRIMDRSQEKLVSGDLAVVTARRRVLELLESPDKLDEFRRVIADGSAFSMHPFDLVSPADDVRVLLREPLLR